MARCAVVDKNNIVINVIIADPVIDTAPEGMTIVETEIAGLGWLWDGNNFTDPTPPKAVVSEVPRFITSRQCRMALEMQGLLVSVEELIRKQDKLTQITWEYASVFMRDDPLLNSLAKNLDLTDEQINQFFFVASEL